MRPGVGVVLLRAGCCCMLWMACKPTATRSPGTHIVPEEVEPAEGLFYNMLSHRGCHPRHFDAHRDSIQHSDCSLRRSPEGFLQDIIQVLQSLPLLAIPVMAAGLTMSVRNVLCRSRRALVEHGGCTSKTQEGGGSGLKSLTRSRLSRQFRDG